MADSLAAWEGIETEHSRSMSKLRAALKRSAAELQAAKAERSQEADRAQSLAQQLQESRQQVLAQGFRRLGFQDFGLQGPMWTLCAMCHASYLHVPWLQEHMSGLRGVGMCCGQLQTERWRVRCDRCVQFVWGVVRMMKGHLSC